MAKVKAKAKKVEKVEKPKVLRVKNNTPYFKVDPDSKVRFNAYETCEVEVITGWLDAQIKAKLFELVE